MDNANTQDLFQKHPSLRNTAEYVALSRNLLRLARAIGGPTTVAAGGQAGDAYAFSDEDDRFYRQHHEAASAGARAHPYEAVRGAYRLGHLASQNPDYEGRPFELIESDLQMLWTDFLRTTPSDWTEVRPYARAAYARASAPYAPERADS